MAKMTKYLLRFLIVLLIPFVFTSCAFNWMGEGEADDAGGDWVKKIDAPEIVHVIQNYLAYLRHEKHLRLEDSSVYYDDYINAVRMEFICQDLLEVREARMLLVDVVEGLLAELNKNPVLAPEFITYPMSPRQLEIYINFESYYGTFLDPYYVGWMKLEKDTSYFYAFDIKYDGRNVWDYRIEPYFKSREFVIYERESEQLFKQAVEMEENTPDYLIKEQYRPVVKCRPRFFDQDLCTPLFK